MRWFKRLFFLTILLFILLNVVIYNHAYNFTHFVDKDIPKLKATTAEDLGDFKTQLSLAFWGIETPKLPNTTKPDTTFEAFTLSKNPQLHAWWIKTPDSLPKGIVILFHGYSANKASLLEPARVFRKLGYHTCLIDFRGHGNSEGNETSIGYYEAEDVKATYDYIKLYYPDLPTILYGASMGAVSVLKAVHDYQLKPNRLIIEAPFGSMKDAVLSRFENMGLPTQVLPDILLFWGGMQTNMNAFKHNTVAYAQKVTIPTLHIHGAKDPKVRRHETDAVFNALGGMRYLSILENCAHDNLMLDDPKAWTAAVWDFLEKPIDAPASE